MRYIALNELEIRARQRTIDLNIVKQLEDSILTKGLLHAPVVALDRETQATFLVAGEHRFNAMSNLHAAGKAFNHDGLPVPPGQVPVVNLSELSPADLLEAELEENIIRAPIPWQDRARALAAIHEMRCKENPTQTFSDTAKEVGQREGRTATSGTLRQEVRNAVLLTQAMDRPSVAKARNATEALGILYKEEEARIGAELMRRKAMASPPSCRVIHGDMCDVLPTLTAGEFDLIIADLPYGINASSQGFRDRTVQHHNYDDSPDLAKRLMQTVLTEGFRVTKTRANLFIFGDVDLFEFFKRAAERMAWKPFRTPIIWGKGSEDVGPLEGLAPWGREGFRRTYEMVFYATKGNKGLLQSPVDVLLEKRVGRADRVYGPEKPVSLMKRLIECSTMPGDSVLDPCCGAGSSLVACKELKRKGLGIELDEAAANLATVAAQREVVMATAEPEMEALA